MRNVLLFLDEPLWLTRDHVEYNLGAYNLWRGGRPVYCKGYWEGWDGALGEWDAKDLPGGFPRLPCGAKGIARLKGFREAIVKENAK